MKAIIFDNDGVLTNAPENFSTKIIREKHAKKEKVNQFFEEVFLPKCMIGTADLKIELKKVLQEWEIQESVETVLDYWFASENCVDEEVKALIKSLREKEIPCYLATNQEQYRTKYMRENMQFNSLFTDIFSSAELGCKKPQEAFYKKILSQINISPQDILYIDDEEKNIRAGELLGLQTHHYKDFKTLKKVLEKIKVL